jgi:type II secretory ATPase GspE/PulE/Tfp pilus assembly ATPase PilB-like protein
MIDLIGVNPIFSTAIRLVIAQRLVRKLDDATKEEYEPDEATRKWVQNVLADLPEHVQKPDLSTFKLWKPVVSPTSPFGYTGRVVIMEQMVVTDEIQKFLRGDIKEVNADAIADAAKAGGMVTLLQRGVLSALSGETTLDEVNRVI